MPRKGSGVITGVRVREEMSHKLQVAGEEMDAMLAIVDHDEMRFVDAAERYRLDEALLF